MADEIILKRADASDGDVFVAGTRVAYVLRHFETYRIAPSGETEGEGQPRFQVCPIAAPRPTEREILDLLSRAETAGFWRGEIEEMQAPTDRAAHR